MEELNQAKRKLKRIADKAAYKGKEVSYKIHAQAIANTPASMLMKMHAQGKDGTDYFLLGLSKVYRMDWHVKVKNV